MLFPSWDGCVWNMRSEQTTALKIHRENSLVFFLEKKSTRHLYFSSTSHLMHDIKMVSLPLSLSFFPTFFPPSSTKQGHAWSKASNRHRPCALILQLLLLLLRSIKVWIQSRHSVEIKLVDETDTAADPIVTGGSVGHWILLGQESVQIFSLTETAKIWQQ